MITVVKIGGNILDDPAALEAFVAKFACLSGKKVLIHGGGKFATQLAEKLHIPQQMVNGRRITDHQTLEIITMVYAGLINKNLVAKLNARGCRAIGVCGADGNLILADKRPVGEIDFGFVGDISSVNAELLKNWLDEGFCPVISPITHDGFGQLLNTNADSIASAVALSIRKYFLVQLVYCFEKNGVLMDSSDDSSVIPILDEKMTNDLKHQGLIHSGMLPKIENAIQTVKGGVDAVFIGQADELELLIEGKSGTKIISELWKN